MRISTGISEIAINRFHGNRIQTEKIFLWPVYGEGKVEKVRGIVKKTDSNSIYSKPLKENVDKVIGQYKRYEKEYSSMGNVLKKNINNKPGMLFDAIA